MPVSTALTYRCGNRSPAVSFTHSLREVLSVCGTLRRLRCAICGRRFDADNAAPLVGHVASHFAAGQKWQCRGVLKEEAGAYGIPSDVPSYLLLGRERVGGCMRTFWSRADLKDHLCQPFNVCDNTIAGRRIIKRWENVETPLDVVLLILRLLTIKDVLSLFATCRKLHLYDCRHVWVHANIDMDRLPSSGGRPRIQYVEWTTEHLRSRVMRAWLVHEAWKTPHLIPRATRVIPVHYEVRRMLVVPGTGLFVTLVNNDICIRDWVSGSNVPVALHPAADMTTVVSIRLLWADCLATWVLFVHLAGAPVGQDPRGVLELFSVDAVSGFATHLTTAAVPCFVLGVDLRDDHFALVGHCHRVPKVFEILSFRLHPRPPVSLQLFASACLQVPVRSPVALGIASFSIIDNRRFVLAGPRGIIIYRMGLSPPDRALPRLRPMWTHFYRTPDILARPPIGAFQNSADGKVSFTVFSGGYLRFVATAPERKRAFAVTAQRIDKTPVYFGVTSGFRVGIYRRPYSTPMITTFSLRGEQAELHPFYYSVEHPPPSKGSIIYRLDEEQGRVLFLVRSHSRPYCNVVVLDLVQSRS
ncbi:hypothetical protein DFH06DRAFT_1323633 [Mycena polygramma]|nr:hypothetical protein DFH06DRAFT_1323633 [Mycena polygramma]